MNNSVKFFVVVLAATLLATPVFSGEVTDQEYNVLGRLVVTYYKGSGGKVECTAYNKSGKPIGGGVGYSQGGVARVQIEVPEKYQGTPLKVECH